MGKIVLLDELTINKIAAGEVIERPASVVKEMVENSIDAGATNITVEIKNGGITYIRVSDNGKGIAQDDLEIAFERHATSKIRSANDLDTVTSMGFRGEALASIAAIANVELISKTEEQEIGYKVVVEGGDILEKEETGCKTGTSITVKNLFFNTPVRYKFLKKDYTETGYIEDAITRIALVHPEIAFKLINSGKTIIQTTGNNDLKSVIYSIYGKDVAEGILEVDYKYEDIEIKGVVGKPEIARSNRANQIFFVNKRYIKDKTLSSAAEQALKGLLPIGKFAFIVLNLEINPSKVDVNVHPAKLEVRFEDENNVFKAVFHSIKDTLLKGDLVSDTEKEKVQESQEERVKNIENSNINGELEQNKGGLFRWKTSSKNENSEEEKETIREEMPTYNVGSPINTEDVLEKLRQLKSKLEKEVTENKNIKLSDNFKNLNLENTENIYNEKTPEDNQEQDIVQIPEEFKEIEQINQIPTEEITAIQEETIETQQNEEEQPENMKIEEITETPVELMETEQSEDISTEEITETPVQSIETEQSEDIPTEEIQKKESALNALKEKIEQLENNRNVITEDFDEMYIKLFGTKPIEEKEELEEREESEDLSTKAIDIIKDNVNVFDDIEEYKKPIYKFIGIAFNTYIILEMEKELYILDQHAAHERIMYEKVKENYYSDETKNSQMLLLPDIITLTHKEMDIARDNMEMFAKAGFELEEFGENTIKLSGVPDICIDLDTKELFLETLDEINSVARTAKQEIEEKFIATVACKAAVKAHMVLSKEEVENLLDNLLELPNPFTCPHGRPTAIKMTQYDIERKFARK